MSDFATRLKLKPGSLTADGAVIDVHGKCRVNGPCFVPFDALSPTRKALMGAAGWHRENRAAFWPGIPQSNRDMCIVRIPARR